MSNAKKDRELMRALLGFCQDVELTETEVDEDLRNEGVDVTAFLARVEKRIDVVKEEERTSRLTAAREKVRLHQGRARTHRYDALDHAALVAEVARRQTLQAQPAAFHRNFEKMTDDDLRTLLEDQDELDDE